MIDIPKDVLDRLRRVFAETNYAASAKLTKVPHPWETSLDQSIINSLQGVSCPVKFKSDWTVSLDTLWLGAFPLWERWEVADIGFLDMFRTQTKLIRSKLALLQSKRL